MTLPTSHPAIELCTACRAPISAVHYNTGNEFPCASCGRQLMATVLPAFYQQTSQVRTGDALVDDSEASCFYHPHKKAAVICSGCGCFLCTLCETDLSGRCLCPSCIDKACRNEEVEQLITRRTLYDRIALLWALLPLLFFPATIITAPIAIYLSIRHWNRAGSILPRTKTRFVIAILIALLQILGWLSLLVMTLGKL